MYRLTNIQKNYIIKLIQEGKELPEEFKCLLFPTKQKEYELIYAGKIRKEDLLANEDGIFPVPLQIDKVFNGERESWDDDWKNMIVFGDNLQFLKTVYENKDPLIKDKVKGKVKLIYIDPPFATESDFKGKEGQKAYRDKTKGAEFVEFLRRRLILAKEILADDGFIIIHLDWKKSHYIKLILDEIFGENLFRNEIIWHYRRWTANSKEFQKMHDTLLLYSKNEKSMINKISVLPSESKQKALNKGYHTNKINGISQFLIYNEEKVNKLINEGKLDLSKYDKIVYVHENQVIAPDVWTDINIINSQANERLGYPTQKPEELLKRIVESTTNPGDLVLDFFAGSGTTAVVAEKLGRRWIAVDIGKFAYYTIQKRILQIENSKDLLTSQKEKKNYKKCEKCGEKVLCSIDYVDNNQKYGKKAKSFITARLGVYDLKQALDLEWKQYLKFVSELFEFEIRNFEIAGLTFDGKKGEYPVKVFDYSKFKDASVDEEYLQNIHKTIGNRLSGRVYIVAPANYIGFIQDYYEIGDIRYYFLKIPYQVIKELHKIPFKKLRQPQSKKNVNDLEEVIGFHFIRQPEVKSELRVEENKVKLIIKEFRSQYYKDEDGKVLDNFETLSAVFINKNYNGEYFEMDEVYFADELLPKKTKKKDDEDDIREKLKNLKENGLAIEIDKKEIGNEIMIVYSDIYGNDFTEILDVKG